MSRRLEEAEEYAIDVIMGKRKGAQASILRTVLLGLSQLYTLGVQARLYLFRKRYIRDHQLGCLVISIGNLTVGGTGKTPVVEKFARALQNGGRRVAILTRGYKSKPPPDTRTIWDKLLLKKQVREPRIVSDGKNVLLDSEYAGDEPYMLAKNLKDVLVIVDKDRVKSGIRAIEEFGADTLLLDDGLQYLHLKHRLDIVLVDCQAPFGNEYLLPRGTLREPPRNLSRASYIFLTKSDGQNEELIKRIRKYNRRAEIIECAHQPLHLENLHSGEIISLDFLKDKYVGALSGIASPESFENGLRRLGATVELNKRFADHHRYTKEDLDAFLSRCIRRDVHAIITTEKDAVRFPKMEALEVPIFFLRVEIQILSGHETWEHCVRRICDPQHISPAEILLQAV
ncbi:MAG TPA: tetraacyldisaccharide 4'-kinase [Chthoniobacterales bacterium]|jgi:tetraacyldisaccharide 4'-kinase